MHWYDLFIKARSVAPPNFQDSGNVILYVSKKEKYVDILVNILQT
jgi:hypothetical protein